MKPALYFLLALSLFACDSSASVTLPGTWQLVATKTGADEFRYFSGDARITFQDNGDFSSTVAHCFRPGPNNGSVGHYETSVAAITLDNCFGNRAITYEMLDGELTLKFPCDEPCYNRYRKVE